MALALSTSDPYAPLATSGDGVLRLLVVEDSDADYDLLMLLLAKSGYRADGIRVETESEMRRALEQRDWDIVISDNRLPNFSAEGAMRVLRSMERDLPFIIVSGSMQEEAAIAAMLDGADDYITKARLARLVPAVERSLRAAEMRRLRHQAESSLRENESRLRALASNVPGMLFELHFSDERLQFSYVSEGSQPLFGIAPMALILSPDLLLNLIEPGDRAALLARLSAPADQLVGIVQWEGRARSSEQPGDMRWIQLGASPRLNVAQRLTWTGVITDITALKLAEAELGRSRDELRQLSAHLAQTRESERARIAREIHDDIGATLTGLRADIAWLKRRFGDAETIGHKLKYMEELVDSAASASMRIVRDLRPAVLDYGFVAAMEWLAQDFQKHAGIACSFSCGSDEVELDRGRAAAIFRIFQELLTNITKHARASKVRARLEIDEDWLKLEVDDDGVGIAINDRRKRDSFGIRGMRERAHELGGAFDIRSSESGGTLAVLRAPRHPASAAN